MLNVNNFKPGITFKEGDSIYVVLENQHSQQGRGQANVKAKIKNLRTGSITIKTWTGGNKVEPAIINKRDMSFLYENGDYLVFMDQENFEQVEIEKIKLEWERNFLKEGSLVKIRKYQEEVLDIELSTNVELVVQTAQEAVKGNTQTNPTKKITLETGFELEVPMFIKENEKIIISTETGKYIGRA